MDNILEDSSLKVLESISVVESLFAFDLDGTLLPANIHYSSMPSVIKETNELLKKISALIPTAIISGRSNESIKSLIDFPPKYLFGNHGIEGILSGESLNKAKIKCRVWKHYLMDFFYVNLFPLGVMLEDKIYSLSINYFNARSFLLAEKSIFEMLKLLPEEVTVLKGEKVVHILPYFVNKSTALTMILEREKKKFCFYIGHDETDEDIFKINDPHWLTLRVGQSSHSKAKYFLESQSEINTLLKKFLFYLERKPS